jgi:hypothetical protein
MCQEACGACAQQQDGGAAKKGGTVRYFANWSVETALRKSAVLIRMGSFLRVASYANIGQGVCHIEAITVDSVHSSGFGQGKIVNGFLLGVPDDSMHVSRSCSDCRCRGCASMKGTQP